MFDNNNSKSKECQTDFKSEVQPSWPQPAKYMESPEKQQMINEMKINISWLILLAVKNLKEVSKFKKIFDSLDEEDPFQVDH